MKRRLTIASLSCLTGLLLTVPSVAQETDYPCYVQQGNRVIDLSKLCGSQSPTRRPLTADTAFLNEFQKLATRYPSPVAQELNAYLRQFGSSAIADAQTTCRVLQFGGPQAAATRQQALAAYNASSITQAKQEIGGTLAITYYCPQFAR